MDGFLSWYKADVLEPGAPYHACITASLTDGAAVPTPASLLFGSGVEVLADTRFGEYQLGMAVRYSRGVFKSAADEAAARTIG